MFNIDGAISNPAARSATPLPATTHPVVAGETIASIAAEHQITPEALASANYLSMDATLTPGQRLAIPAATQLHTASGPDPDAPPTQPQTPLDQAIKNYHAMIDQGENGTVVNAAYQAITTAAQAQIVGGIPGLRASYPGMMQNQLTDQDLAQQLGTKLAAQYPHDPAIQSALQAAVKPAGDQARANDLISAAKALASPDTSGQAALSRLGSVLQGQPASVIAYAQNNAEVQAWVTQTASDVNAKWGGHAENRSAATDLLYNTVKDLPPDLAAQVVQQSAGVLQKIIAQGSPLGAAVVYGDLSKIYAVVSGTPAGATLSSMVTQGIEAKGIDPSTIKLAVTGQGADLSLSTTVAKQLMADGKTGVGAQLGDAALEAMQAQVDGDAKDYNDKISELAWFQKNEGSVMTPEQKNQAVKDYFHQKGADWVAGVNDAQDKLQADTKTLNDMLVQMNGLSPALKQTAPMGMGSVQDRIGAITKDASYQEGLRLELDQHPEDLEGEGGEGLLNVIAENVEKGNISRELAGHVAQALVTAKLKALPANYNLSDPADRAKVVASLEGLRDSKFATLLGIPAGKESEFNEAIDAVEESVPAAGDDAAAVEAKLSTLDEKLGSIDILSGNTTANQLFRFAGVAAAGVGFINSANKELSDPDLQNSLSLFSSSAGLTKYGVDLGKSLSLLDQTSRMAGTAGTVFLSLAASVSDFVTSGLDFTHGNPVEGTLTAIRGFSSFALLASEDPVIGIPAAVIDVVTTLGISQYQHVQEANKYEPASNSYTVPFLMHAGLNEATAKALCDQSGNGYSSVTLLAEYAKDKGYDLSDPQQQQQFSQWLNGIDSFALMNFREAMCMTLDKFGGDPTKLSADTLEYVPTRIDVTGNPLPDPPTTVGQIDAYLKGEGASGLPSRH